MLKAGFEGLIVSKGQVEFVALAQRAKYWFNQPGFNDWDWLTDQFAIKKINKTNLVFNYPREQYAKLDRGETPGAINAQWFTLSADAYNDPAVETVSGESLRVQQTTLAVDATNTKNSVVRFILDEGQFIGSWATAVLIGGPTATSTPGTGKIIAAVNDVEDDLGNPLERMSSTIHLVNWKLKHLDSSEV